MAKKKNTTIKKTINPLSHLLDLIVYKCVQLGLVEGRDVDAKMVHKSETILPGSEARGLEGFFSKAKTHS